MTNPYYTESFSGQPGQTARAESVAVEFDGVSSGFDIVWTQMQAAIRSTTSGEVLGPLPPVVNRADKFLKFDASGNPQAVTTPLNVRGAWQPSTAYAIGDAYTSTPNGSLYYVKSAYTSGATFGSTDTSNTTLLVNLGGLFFVNNTVVNSAGTYALAAGQSVLADSSNGALIFTLPASPQVGDSPINITNIGGSLSGAQTITINAGSNKIMGNTDNVLNMDVANASTTLMWAGVPYGWRLRTMG
jgi:hypothetical protein